MNQGKYLSVIHVPTDRIVTAFKLENDATWIGKEKEELVATANYCEPGKKIKMIFVKSYTRKDDKFIHAYFRSAPNQSGLLLNMSGESNEHRKAKENIYDGIYSGDILINGNAIDKNDIDDIYIEYRNSLSGNIIPDIMIKFKKEHIKYGLGIFLEIQLSEQKTEETEIRTYQRVIEGFSGIWLWEKNFDENHNIINKDLKVKSYKQLLIELEEKIENKFINKINRYGNIIDKKLIDFKKDMWDYYNSNYKVFQIEINKISKDEINKIEIENEKLSELKKLANELNDAFYKTNVNKLSESINKAVNEGLNYLTESINNKNNDLLKLCIDKNIKKLKKICPKCGNSMNIGKAIGGYNWYCSEFPRCDGIIKEVDFNED